MSVERSRIVKGFKCFVEGNLIKDDYTSPYLYTYGEVVEPPKDDEDMVLVFVEASHRELSEELRVPIEDVYYTNQSREMHYH